MIEIHIDGKTVTKLQAARAVANLDGEPRYVDIGEAGEDGLIRHEVTVHPREHAYGSMQPAEVGWPSIGSVPAAAARVFAESLTLGAEIAELAEMIAAEQARAQCADCDQPLDGRELACISAGCPSRPAEPARISEAAIDKALAATLGVCPASTGPDDELDREVYCDKQLGEDTKHAGNHHAQVEGGGAVNVAVTDSASAFADGPGCGAEHPIHEGIDGYACTEHSGGMHWAPAMGWPIRRDAPGVTA
jgi:hypothetical protein